MEKFSLASNRSTENLKRSKGKGGRDTTAGTSKNDMKKL
jgi:hypothetical protein